EVVSGAATSAWEPAAACPEAGAPVGVSACAEATVAVSNSAIRAWRQSTGLTGLLGRGAFRTVPSRSGSVLHSMEPTCEGKTQTHVFPWKWLPAGMHLEKIRPRRLESGARADGVLRAWAAGGRGRRPAGA